MRAKLLAVGVMLAVVGCGGVDTQPSPVSEEAVQPPPAFVLQPLTLREAVSQVYGADCGNEMHDPSYQRSEAMIAAAKPADLQKAFTDVVSAPARSSWCVGGLARAAADMPFWAELRDGLRARRDQMTERRDDAYLYFARHGDATDLSWMEENVGKLGQYERGDGEKAIGNLRERLRAEGM